MLPFCRSSSLPNFARRHPSQSSRNTAVNKRDSTLSDTQPEGNLILSHIFSLNFLSNLCLTSRLDCV
jgi:hypothetical protein